MAGLSGKSRDFNAGQPDCATIYIGCVPGERTVEPGSRKLYLYSVRNHGDWPPFPFFR